MVWRDALRKVTAPVVAANDKLYKAANAHAAKALRGLQGPQHGDGAGSDGAQSGVGASVRRATLKWLTHGLAVGGGKRVRAADAITTARSALVVPTLGLFANGYTVLPAALVVANVTFDYVDGAVARFENEQRLAGQAPALPRVREGLLPSTINAKLAKTWGAYYDAIADKAFAIPVWVACFHQFPDAPLLQAGLLSHIAIEGYSSYVRTRAYFREPAPLGWVEPTPPPPPPPAGARSSGSDAARHGDGSGGKRTQSDATQQGPEPAASANAPSASSVVAGIVGKTKQFMAMLGTAMVMVPVTQPLGTVLICAAVPLALASVLQKSSSLTVYAELTAGPMTPAALEYIQQSKALGSRLIVGVRPSDAPRAAYEDLVRMLRLNSAVDYVLRVQDLPAHGSLADHEFVKKHSIDVVAVPASASFETVDSRPEDWKSGKIVPVSVNIPSGPVLE